MTPPVGFGFGSRRLKPVRLRSCTNFTVEKSSRLPDEKDRSVTGHYYRLPAANFPTIDSLFLIHPTGEPSPILPMFQITRNIE